MAHLSITHLKGEPYGNQGWYQRLRPHWPTCFSGNGEGVPEFDIVAINDTGSITAAAHLLNYDSIHGRVYDKVRLDGDYIRS